VGALTDARSFEAFYRRHAQAVLVFLTRRTLDPELALDLTAEVFATAYRQRAKFRGSTERDAAAWVFKIAANLHLRYLRRGHAERRALERLGIETPALTESDTARIEELAGLAELREQVAERFAELPAAQRDAVALRVVDDLSYPEIASRLGITEDTARARVSRGLRMLRGLLRPSHEGSAR
jgi:RNA polymerase sigma factor (sigma-70 family)